MENSYNILKTRTVSVNMVISYTLLKYYKEYHKKPSYNGFYTIIFIFINKWVYIKMHYFIYCDIQKTKICYFTGAFNVRKKNNVFPQIFYFQYFTIKI